ncbi:MAG: cache domain-containing protein, partial [Dehalococcoidales bacterium]
MAEIVNKIKSFNGVLRLNIQRKLILMMMALVAVFVGVSLGYILPSEEESLLTQRENEVKAQVQTAWALVDSLYQQAVTGAIMMDSAQSLAMKEVGALRYGDDNSGYFWISDTLAYMVMHPIKPEMNGQDESQYKD